jgi:hypothetical protein
MELTRIKNGVGLLERVPICTHKLTKQSLAMFYLGNWSALLLWVLDLKNKSIKQRLTNFLDDEMKWTNTGVSL